MFLKLPKLSQWVQRLWTCWPAVSCSALCLRGGVSLTVCECRGTHSVSLLLLLMQLRALCEAEQTNRHIPGDWGTTGTSQTSTGPCCLLEFYSKQMCTRSCSDHTRPRVWSVIMSIVSTEDVNSLTLTVPLSPLIVCHRAGSCPFWSLQRKRSLLAFASSLQHKEDTAHLSSGLNQYIFIAVFTTSLQLACFFL